MKQKHVIKEFLTFLRYNNRLALASLTIIVVLLLLAVVAPYIIPYPQDTQGSVNLAHKLLAPSSRYLFGTDEMGRDMFSRTIYGTRLSFEVAFFVIVLSATFGIAYGLIAGYLGGIIDTAMMRVCEVFLSFPSLLLAIAISAILGPSLTNTTISIAVSWWPWFAQLIRNETIAIKEKGFVEAAKTMGVSTPRIIYQHIWKNVVPVVIVQISMSFGSVILTAASLSFLGLGVQPPTPEWGLMVSTGKNYFLTSWWYITFPGLFIFITVMAFNFFGDGLRDFYDPKTRNASHLPAYSQK